MDAKVSDAEAGTLCESWRPERCDRIALVLQGGGALGAYQAGVYQALHEAHIEPDWVSGVSIGAIYRQRNLVERFFNKLKHFRRIATRYDKLARNFLAAVLLASSRLRMRTYESTT